MDRPEPTLCPQAQEAWRPNQTMKKLCLVLIALACLPALATGQAAQGGQVVEEIITRVNNQIITRSEFERSKDQLKDEVKQQDPKDPDKAYADREKDILRDLIDQQLLLDKGKDLGITGDTDLIKRLDQMRKDMKLESMEDLEKEATKQGVSWEDFKQNMRNQIITQKVIGEEVGGQLAISKEEEQKFYDDHKSEMEQPEYIRLSEILVAPKSATPLHHPPHLTRAQPRQPLPLNLQSMRPPKRPPTPRPSAPPKPRPMISSNRSTMAPISRTSPRNILTARRPPTAARLASSSAASWQRNSKTRRSP